MFSWSRLKEKLGGGRVFEVGPDGSSHRRPSNPRGEGCSVEQHDTDPKDDLREKTANPEERVQQLESQMKELRSENLQKKADVEILMQRLEDAKQLEFSFLELLRWLQKMLGKVTGEVTAGDMENLVSILAKYGLTVDKNYEPGREGFICVKDIYVVAPEVSLPVIARQNDIILEGIVKVPVSFAGAEPPVGQTQSETPDEAMASDNSEGTSLAHENDKVLCDDDDDFVVTPKGRPKK